MTAKKVLMFVKLFGFNNQIKLIKSKAIRNHQSFRLACSMVMVRGLSCCKHAVMLHKMNRNTHLHIADVYVVAPLENP